MDALIGITGLLGIMVCIILSLVQLFKKNKSKSKKFGLLTIVFSVLFVIGVSMSPTTMDTASKDKEVVLNADVNSKEGSKDASTAEASDETKVVPIAPTSTVENTENTQGVSGQLKVHFINVGQADSILIVDGDKSMLIDAGNNGDADTVTNYIKNQGIKKLDIVIGSHAHEDHIGGMDKVINSFDIGTIYLPKQQSNTKTFEDVLMAIKGKGLKVSSATPGTDIKLNSATGKILAPNGSSYEDINDSSIVLKLTFGSNSFMFTGDAEGVSENEILNNGFNLKADLLKVGHHGSSSSTTDRFLNAVNPKYAVIMVGQGNSYGHPHKPTMDRFKAKGTSVYRTDENGTIIATSDGTNVSFNTNAGSYAYAGNGSSASGGGSSNSGTGSNSSNTTAPKPETKPSTPPTTGGSDKLSYYTPNGKSYHFDKSCTTLSRSKTINEGKLSDVINLGKADPCDKCAY